MADYNFSQSYRQDLAPFNFPEGQNPLTALASGVASGYQAGQERQQRLDDIASAEGMAGGKLTGSEKRGLGLQGNLLTDMAKGFLGAPGIEAQARNPLLSGQMEHQQLQNKEQRQNLSLQETLMQNPGGILKEFSSMTNTTDMFKFLQRNAGLNALPLGQKLWGGMADVAGKIALAENRATQAEMNRIQLDGLTERARANAVMRSRGLDISEKNLGVRERNARQADLRSQMHALQMEHDALSSDYRIEGMPDMDTSQAPSIGGGSAPVTTPETVGGEPALGPPAPVQRPRLVPNVRPPTTANVTTYQNTLNNGILSARRIQQIIPHINANTVGPMAALKSIVVDRGLANLYPELADVERISSGQLMELQAREMVRQIRSDSSIGVKEQEGLISMMPRTSEMLNSPARALPQIKIVARELANKARQAAEQLHAPIPDELKTPVEIRAEMAAGKLTYEEARKRIMTSPFYVSDADLKE